MSEIDSNLIRKGFWIDWSKGHVLGATITTSTTSGNVVIALLAVLVSLAIDHLWNLTLFALYQARASRATGDAVFQQQQALIRALPTPFFCLCDMIKVGWAWRRSGRTTRSRLLTTMLVGLVILIFGGAAIAASIFSSYIVMTSNLPVLVAPNGCFVDYNTSSLVASTAEWISQSLNMAQQYVDRCYSDRDVTGCNIFVQPRVHLDSQNSSCLVPDAEFCVANDPATLVIDSGLVDSNDILGINDKPGNRVVLRRQTTYSPVRIQNQFTMIDATDMVPYIISRDPLPGEQGFSFNYGHVSDIIPIPDANTTLIYPTFASNNTKDYVLSAVTNYTAGFLFDNYAFELIPELYTADADTALVFIFSNLVGSPCPIEDPVFASHRVRCCPISQTGCVDEYIPGDDAQCFYNADYPAGVMVAQQRYQFCLVDDAGNHAECTELIRNRAGSANEILPSANAAQRATLDLLASTMFVWDLESFYWMDHIAASQSLTDSNQACLPATQWMTEAYRLESMIWTLLQLTSAYHAGGPFSSSVDNSFVGPNTPAQTRLCESQKVVKPGGFANINVLGLSLIVALSGLVVAADIFLLKIFVFMTRSHPSLGPRFHRWIQDGVLQLQRRAYEADGVGPWKNLDNDEVPILADEQQDLSTFSSAHTQTGYGETSTGSSHSQNELSEKGVRTASVIERLHRRKAPMMSSVQSLSPATSNSSVPPLIFSNDLNGRQNRDGELWSDLNAPLPFSDSLSASQRRDQIHGSGADGFLTFSNSLPGDGGR